MDSKVSISALALSLALSTTAPVTSAALLQAGDLLTITPGVAVLDAYGSPAGVASGSWFGVDMNGDAAVADTERFVTSPGTAGGLIVGQTQAPGEIEQSSFFGQDAWLYTVTAPTSGDGTLDFTGLRWLWGTSGVSWTFGGGAWTPTNAADFGAPTSGYTDGVARFEWSGVYGDSYSLWYSTTEPFGSPTGCGGCQFFWHLEGTVVATPVPLIPVPAAVWLLGSGLIGLLGIARRRT